MKNGLYKKGSVYAVILILILLVITPSVNSASEEKNEEPACLGTIYGHTHTAYCWAWMPVNFAKIDAGVRKTMSTLNGFYILTGLPLGKTYIVTASKRGYYSDTKEITLTKDKPVVKQLFDLQPKEDDIKDSRTHQNNKEESSCFGFGFIYGRIGTYMWSGWCSVYNVKIDAGIRKKICGGHYFLCFLPLDRTYTITASKEGWETETREVILTKNNLIERVDFTLRSDNDNQVEYIPSNENTEETKCIGKIYGYTHCSHGVWTWDPIPHARVRVGLTFTRSNKEGYYEITGLPVNRTYRIIATRLGYLRTVEKVTLTSEKPEKKVYIDMYSFIDWLFDLF